MITRKLKRGFSCRVGNVCFLGGTRAEVQARAYRHLTGRTMAIRSIN